MAAFLKSLVVAVYERVILSYRSTLIGIGLAAMVLVLEQSVTALQALPQGWAKVLASLLVVIGASLKAKTYPQPVPPTP